MAVDIHCRLDGCVVELLSDIVQRLALLEKKTGERVAHVMDSDLRDVGLDEDLPPWVSSEPTGIDLLACDVRKQQLDCVRDLPPTSGGIEYKHT